MNLFENLQLMKESENYINNQNDFEKQESNKYNITEKEFQSSYLHKYIELDEVDNFINMIKKDGYCLLYEEDMEEDGHIRTFGKEVNNLRNIISITIYENEDTGEKIVDIASGYDGYNGDDELFDEYFKTSERINVKTMDDDIGNIKSISISSEHNEMNGKYYAYAHINHTSLGEFYISFANDYTVSDIRTDGKPWNFLQNKEYLLSPTHIGWVRNNIEMLRNTIIKKEVIVMNLFENLQLMKEATDKFISDNNIWVHTFGDVENHKPKISDNDDCFLGPGFYLYNTTAVSKQFNKNDINYNEYYVLKKNTNIITLNSVRDEINVSSLFGFKKCNSEQDLINEIKTNIGYYFKNGGNGAEVNDSNVSWYKFVDLCDLLKTPRSNFVKFMISHNIDAIIVNDTSNLYVGSKKQIVKEMCVFNLNILEQIDKNDRVCSEYEELADSLKMYNIGLEKIYNFNNVNIKFRSLYSREKMSYGAGFAYGDLFVSANREVTKKFKECIGEKIYNKIWQYKNDENILLVSMPNFHYIVTKNMFFEDLENNEKLLNV